MQTIDLRDQFYLRRAKIIFLFLICWGGCAWAQKGPITYHRPDSDNKTFKYGFFLGMHQNSYAIQYSDLFETDQYENIESITPRLKAGFNLGFMFNIRLHEQFDLRVVPVKIALYQHEVDYNRVDGEVDTQLIESTRIEPGIFLRYRSIRRGNSRMYVIGGISGSQRSGKADEDPNAIRLAVKKTHLAAEIGFGADLYFKYFKFSPELRYAHGLTNVLAGDSNIYTDGLKRVTTHNFSLYLHFSD